MHLVELLGGIRHEVLPEFMAEISGLESVFRRHTEILEARLFGSASRGRRGSDIDIGVIVDSNDPEWSGYTMVRKVAGSGEEGEPIYELFPGHMQTRGSLEDEVVKECPRAEVHIATLSDLERIKIEGSPIHPELLFQMILAGYTREQALTEIRKATTGFGRDMMKGRLIYKRI